MQKNSFWLLLLFLIALNVSNISQQFPTLPPSKTIEQQTPTNDVNSGVFLSLHSHKTSKKRHKHRNRLSNVLPLLTAESNHESNHDGESGEHAKIAFNSADFWIRIAMVTGLLCIAGLMAGLTIGIMALDSTHLRILKISGTPTERYYASVVEPLRNRGHLLLSTLLITNMLANETLPIILDDLLSGGWMAVFVSTALVVLFAEIIPQAICAKYGLAIGARSAWLVKILMVVLFPITWPIARILEYFLGEHHGTLYRRAELKELVALHAETAGGDLHDDEVRIIKSVLDLKTKTAFEVMTPLSEVFMLNMDTNLDSQALKIIASAGYSRIPIYIEDRQNIVGVMLAKDLIGLHNAHKVRDLRFLMRPILFFSLEDSLFSLFDKFLDSKAHLAAVVRPEAMAEISAASSGIRSSVDTRLSIRTEDDDHSGILTSSSVASGSSGDLKQVAILGIVTFEDVLEAMIGEDIVDETDLYVNTKTKIENDSNMLYHAVSNAGGGLKKRKSRKKGRKSGKSSKLKRSHSAHSVASRTMVKFVPDPAGSDSSENLSKRTVDFSTSPQISAQKQLEIILNQPSTADSSILVLLVQQLSSPLSKDLRQILVDIQECTRKPVLIYAVEDTWFGFFTDYHPSSPGGLMLSYAPDRSLVYLLNLPTSDIPLQLLFKDKSTLEYFLKKTDKSMDVTLMDVEGEDLWLAILRLPVRQVSVETQPSIVLSPASNILLFNNGMAVYSRSDTFWMADLTLLTRHIRHDISSLSSLEFAQQQEDEGKVYINELAEKYQPLRYSAGKSEEPGILVEKENTAVEWKKVESLAPMKKQAPVRKSRPKTVSTAIEPAKIEEKVSNLARIKQRKINS